MPFTKDPAPIVRSTSRPTAISFRRDVVNAVVVDMYFDDMSVSHSMLLSASSLTAQQKSDLGALIDTLGSDGLLALGFSAS